MPNFTIGEFNFSRYRYPKFSQVHFCINLNVQLLPGNPLLYIDFPVPSFATGKADGHYRVFAHPWSPVLPEAFDSSP